MRSEESLRREEELAKESPPAVATPPLERLPRPRLAKMQAAGEDILECYRVLGKAGLNVVGEVLRGRRKFVEYDHYPKHDVYDRETGAQYYYHAHRGIEGEHGHFHTFLRERLPGAEERVVHLVAISMDAYGYPIGLFVPNRWVAGDDWCPADEVAAKLARFQVDHAWPSWPVNRWISAMLVLFGPHIEAMLVMRELTVQRWQAELPLLDVLECRTLEILAHMPVSVEETLAATRRALQ
jgi:hypothetical protein